MMNRVILLVVLLLLPSTGACGNFADSLSGHARPAAQAAGYTLGSAELGQIMADSQMPDSALTPHWAHELARLWVDYVVLATVYIEPDTTRSVDYSRLLVEGRILDEIAVARYRDSVVLAGVEPTEAEMREYFEGRQPYTRLDVRRLVLSVPDEATEAVRDSLATAAEAIRSRLVGGADFVRLAREASSEPTQARGQILAYQGHKDFPAVADSLLFELQPGEISPVIATEDEFLIYRIEARRSPDFDATRELLYEMMVEERQEQRKQEALNDILGRARRTVLDGAVDVAYEVARDPDLAVRRISGRTRLVTWEGGELSVEELRRLFVVRDDLRRVFADASEDDVQYYLLRLAQDEILVTTATRSGVEVQPEERERLAAALGDRLSLVASELGISRSVAVDPRFRAGEEGKRFLQHVLEQSRGLRWLADYRIVLDPLYGVRLDDVGVRNAVRRAHELRASRIDAADPGLETPAESSGVVRVEVG